MECIQDREGPGIEVDLKAYIAAVSKSLTLYETSDWINSVESFASGPSYGKRYTRGLFTVKEIFGFSDFVR